MHVAIVDTHSNRMFLLLDSKDAKWSWDSYVSQRSLLEAEKVRCQLESLMVHFDVDLVSVGEEDPTIYRRIHEAIVCGFFMQVAHKEGKAYVTIKDNQQVFIHPSCGLVDKPEWVMFNEFVLTSRPFIRTVTGVDPEW